MLDHPGKNKGQKKNNIKNWGDQDICELQHKDMAHGPTFWKCKTWIFSNQWWIPWAPKEQAASGDWGPAPQDSFEILMLWRGQSLS